MRAEFGSEERSFRWGMVVLLLVLYALFLNPRCWPAEKVSSVKAKGSPETTPTLIFVHQANPYAAPELKLIALGKRADGQMGSGQWAVGGQLWKVPQGLPPEAFAQASLSQGDGRQAGWKAGPALQAPPQAATPHSADQVLLSVYDAVNGALKANATPAGGSVNPSPHNLDQVMLAAYDATNSAVRINCVTGCGGGGGSSNTFQVNGTGLTSLGTINFENSAATNGLTLTFSNPSAGNISLVSRGR